MDAFLTKLLALLSAGWDIFTYVLSWSLPLLPLAGWIIFWLFAVNWQSFRKVLWQGGAVGVLLMGGVAVLVWGSIAPPDGGTHSLFTLTVSNYVGKTVYVASLLVIMFLCGAVQLSGATADCCRFTDEADESDLHEIAH